MRILVTGASGFIGGHLVQTLAKEGAQVRILARPSSKLHHLAGLPLETIYGDLDDKQALQLAVKDVQIIYHCAALSSDWGTTAQFHKANVDGVRNIIEAALHSDTLERFVHISTTDVYGYPVQPCDESYPITDIGLAYNASKGLGEKVVWAAYREHGLPVTIIRPVSVYGPRGTEFTEKIGEHIQRGSMAVFDGGRTHAGLLYIDNAVDAIMKAALASVAIGQAYNLRDDMDTTWREYVDAFAKLLCKPKPRLNLPAKPALVLSDLLESAYRRLRIRGEPPLTRHAILILARDQGYGIAKIKRDLGFTSTIGLEQGLEKSVEWLQKYGER
jgi:nucleoside-diphosphate-sugar epimerase